MTLLALLACHKPPTRPEPPAEPVVLRIAALNDFHGALYEAGVKGADGEAFGGLPWLVAAVDALRAEDEDLLVLDGGDEFQGSWPVNQTRGMGAIQALELVGVDVAAVGNHEFDHGPAADGAGHPLRGAFEAAAARGDWFATANVRERDGARWQPTGVKPWRLLERKGLRIGVVGLSTTDTPTTTRAEHVADLTFTDPVEEVKALLPELAASDLDVTLLVGHLTGGCEPGAYAVNDDRCTPDGEIGRLLTELPAGTFDAMILGHAHTVLHHRVGDTFLLENRSSGHLLGRLDLVVGPDGVDLDQSVLHDPWALRHAPADPGCTDAPFPAEPRDVGGRPLAPDPESLALVDALEDQAGSLCEEIACASRTLERRAAPESELGAWMTDAMRAAFPGAHLAVQNAGGIRADLPQGTVRRETLQRIMPFDNRTLLVELTGAQVRELFRIGTSGAHGVLHLSGGTITVDPEKDGAVDRDGDGEVEEWERDRLCAVTVGDAALDEAATYRVVVSDFLYGGGDHLGPAFAGAKVVDSGPLLRDVYTAAADARTTCFGDDRPAPRILTGACRTATPPAPAAPPPARPGPTPPR
jgi:5'-nucleotidase